MQRDKLSKYLREYLKVDEFEDYGPNGLQVEGRAKISTIVTAVSASVELFEKALQAKADAIIVHHGLIWNFERPLYKGGYRQRVKLLLENNINLYGFHLPLDAHPEVGNNAQIARLLNLQKIKPFGEYKGNKIGTRGELNDLSPKQIFNNIKKDINPDCLLFAYGPPRIKQVGIISGGAQKEVKQAVLQDLDLFITGEASEYTRHYVKEEKLHFVAAGHHATERFGIQALGKHLQNKFGLDLHYIEVPNPV